MKAQTFPELKPKVVLGIAAHPDDLDFGAAGTMAKLAQAGVAIHYLILTDGSKGSADRKATPIELTKTRQAEQQKAVRLLGGKGVEFLGHPDGELEVTLQLKKEIVKVIRTIKPDIVITMDPSMLYSSARGFINHPDHRAAGQATLDAVFPLARDHLSFPELYSSGLEPHITPTVLLINFNDSNYFVDITATLQQKLDAICAHSSQVSDPDKVHGWVEEMATQAGQAAGCEHAESFVRIDIQG